MRLIALAIPLLVAACDPEHLSPSSVDTGFEADTDTDSDTDSDTDADTDSDTDSDTDADTDTGVDPLDVDDDGDGFTENQGDCNDANAGINPGEVEQCGDGVDQDCDGVDQDCPDEIPATSVLTLSVEFDWARQAVINYGSCAGDDPTQCAAWTGLNASDGDVVSYVTASITVTCDRSARFNTAEDLNGDGADDNWVAWQDGLGGCLPETSLIVAELDGSDVSGLAELFPYGDGCSAGISGEDAILAVYGACP